MRNGITRLIAINCMLILLASCSIQKKIGKEANRDIFINPVFAPANVGISLYDPSTQQYLYNYQAEKSFIPASNMKLFTCYVAMKYLGDSLVGLRYVDKGNGIIEAEGNGDPSFLHPDFTSQPVYDFLKSQKKVLLSDANWKENALGAGWAWDDFNSDYMAERSALPVYGNLVHFAFNGKLNTVPAFLQKNVRGMELASDGHFGIRRLFGSNGFTITTSQNKFSAADIPFTTSEDGLVIKMLRDTLSTMIEPVHTPIGRLSDVRKIYSQKTDSLLKIMMHRSDNFFAEQTLLMVSSEKLGMMNDAKIIDTLLQTAFKELPQKPKWVDGSGLSRYNLVSPQDFVWVLTQMKNEFSWDRIKEILPTGGEGTLSGLYKNYEGRIYAKTGTLSNHVALSGFIRTKKGRQLVFSVMINAHQTSAANIRKGIEKFLGSIMDSY